MTSSLRLGFAAKTAAAASSAVGRDHHLGEDFGDDLGRRRIQRPVHRDDAAIGRDGIAAQRLLVGLGKRCAGRHAAGIGVLDDGDRRRIRGEVGDQLEGGVGVVDVVVGERFSLQLPGLGDARAGLGGEVERGRLVRVLAVAQPLAQPPGDDQAVGKVVARVLRVERGDRRVIGGGAGEGARGKPCAQGARNAALLQRSQHGAVIGRVGEDRDPGGVLGRGADHGRPADIDVLDRLGTVGAARRASPRTDRGSRRGNRCPRCRAPASPRRWSGSSRSASRPPWIFGCSVLTRPSIISGMPVTALDVGDGEAGLLQGARRPAGGEDLDAVRGERAGEIDDAGLVGDRDQRPADVQKLRAGAGGSLGSGHFGFLGSGVAGRD